MPHSLTVPPLAAELQELRALLPQSEVPRGGGHGRKECNVQVFCRFRGPSAGEAASGRGLVWDLGPTTVSASNTAGLLANSTPSFGFDGVFGPDAQQAEIYAAVEPVVCGVLQGVNGAVMCYGQTSAGKTFTMEGQGGPDSEFSGLIPRALSTIFDTLASTPEGVRPWRIALSMLEVYMERLRDLFDPDSEAELRIIDGGARGVQVIGLREIVAKDLPVALDLFQAGRGNRSVAATGMNDRSSRSHSVFMLRVEFADGRHGKLCLVDLAGSECLKKSCFKVDDATAANAEIVEEAKTINQSLTTLGLVISKLADRKRPGSEAHVPYRSSKLTRVLQDTLGGNSQTVVVVNCASSPAHAAETLSTLRFGSRARSVVNNTTGSQATDETLLRLTLRAARLEILRLQCACGDTPEKHIVPEQAIGNKLSQISALTSCSEGISSLLITPRSPSNSRHASPRASRGGAAAGSLWQPSAGSSSPIRRRSLGYISPLQLSPRSLAPSRRVSRCSRRVSLSLSQQPSACSSSPIRRRSLGCISPLQLSPRSLAPSRRVSRCSRRVSLSLSEAGDRGKPHTGVLSPLEISPSATAAPSQAVSRRVSWCRASPAGDYGTPPTGMLSPLELSPSATAAPSQAVSRRVSWCRARPTSSKSEGSDHRGSLSTEKLLGSSTNQQDGFDGICRGWEHPLTKREKFERSKLVWEEQVDKLQEQLDFERSHYGVHVQRLTDQLAILQTENQWLTADRMQHMERVVRSSLEGNKFERSPGSDTDSKDSTKQLADAQASGVLDELRTALLNEQHNCSKLQSTCDDLQLQLQSAKSCMSALHDELLSSQGNLQESVKAEFEFSLLADQRATELAGERTRHDAERSELCKELQFAKETSLESQRLQALSKAQMVEAQEKCREREQSFVDELTEALAVNKSLKEDLAHAEGALYTATRARELAGESSLLAAKALAEERAAAKAVCEDADRPMAELKAELEEPRRSAATTKQALDACLVEMECQLQAATTGECKVHDRISHEARALPGQATAELGPTPGAVQLVGDGSGVHAPEGACGLTGCVEELNADQSQSPDTPTEEVGQDVQQQSDVKETQRAVANVGSQHEELFATERGKHEQQDVQVHSYDGVSEQNSRESCMLLCLSAGARHMLRSWLLRAAGTPLRFVAILGAIVLMCVILGSRSILGFTTPVDVSRIMSCADPGGEAGTQTGQWLGQPQK